MRQVGTTFSQRYMEETLGDVRASPASSSSSFASASTPSAPRSAPADAESFARLIEQEIDAVPSLDEDRILRGFLRLIQATLRTNYFQLDADGRRSRTSPSSSIRRSSPTSRCRPEYEIWVYSPRAEGVHLRGGKVARGGIRWSDRREDFRNEVLGLMKAQMVKNAVIVPVGAKGGFVVKRPPADREALREEVVSCYRTLMRGLLDVTDNIVGGETVPPPDVVRYDGDDPYLVVAADKGTAIRSRTASPPSTVLARDAFASGARPDTTTRRWASPRAGPGSRSSGTSGSSGSTCRRRTSRWSASATCPATSSATACSSPAT